MSCQDEALILEKKVLALDAPIPRTLRAFKTCVQSTTAPLLWDERDRYLFGDERDLVALAPIETDRLNIFLQTYLGWFLKVSLPSRLPQGENLVSLFARTV